MHVVLEEIVVVINSHNRGEFSFHNYFVGTYLFFQYKNNEDFLLILTPNSQQKEGPVWNFFHLLCFFCPLYGLLVVALFSVGMYFWKKPWL